MLSFHISLYEIYLSSLDVVTAVPRYDGDTYQGRVNVYNPPTFGTIVNSVQASGSQVNYVHLYIVH